MNDSDLESLAQFMVRYKIVHLKHGATEITMSPEAFVDAEPAVQVGKPAESNPDNVVGRIGLTKAQELELFNQVFPEDFEKR